MEHRRLQQPRACRLGRIGGECLGERAELLRLALTARHENQAEALLPIERGEVQRLVGV